MAKKDKKDTKKKDGANVSRDPSDVVDAVRGAVERTFQATAGGTEGARDRGRSLLDDVASAAQRIRESFDDLRVLEDVRGLRSEIEALQRRVAELEKQAAKPAPARTASRTGTGTRSTTRSSGARSGRAKAPAKPTAAGTAAAKAGAKPKPKPAASRRKPAAPRSPSSGGAA